MGNILRYSIDSDFLTATDGFSLALYSEDLEDLRHLTRPLQPISIYINDQLQLTGRVDKQTIAGDGSVIEIAGRDYLSVLVDAHIDANTTIKEGMTLVAGILEAVKPYGIDAVLESNNAMRSTQSGAYGFQGAPVKNPHQAKLKDGKPGSNEGAWEFVSRVAALQGFLVQPAFDRRTLTLCAPEYRQEPLYLFRRFRNGVGNTIQSGTVTRDYGRVPTFTYAFARHGTPEDTIGTSRNGFSTFGDGAPSSIGQHPEVRRIVYSEDGTSPQVIDFRWFPKNASPDNGGLLYRPLAIAEKASKTQAELENVIKRELAERLRDTLVCEYTIPGHSIGGRIITPDTMATVQDEIGGVNETLWVARRTFTGDSQGTTTAVVLYRPDSYVI